MIDRNQIIEEFLESIDCPVIVEGIKDEDALKRLGVEDVVVLNKGQSLLETVESLMEYGEVAILTDMDQHGKILRKKLINLFQLYGIREKKRPRELFSKLRLSHVEGL